MRSVWNHGVSILAVIALCSLPAFGQQSPREAERLFKAFIGGSNIVTGEVVKVESTPDREITGVCVSVKSQLRGQPNLGDLHLVFNGAGFKRGRPVYNGQWGDIHPAVGQHLLVVFSGVGKQELPIVTEYVAELGTGGLSVEKEMQHAVEAERLPAKERHQLWMRGLSSPSAFWREVSLYELHRSVGCEFGSKCRGEVLNVESELARRGPTTQRVEAVGSIVGSLFRYSSSGVNNPSNRKVTILLLGLMEDPLPDIRRASVKALLSIASSCKGPEFAALVRACGGCSSAARQLDKDIKSGLDFKADAAKLKEALKGC